MVVTNDYRKWWKCQLVFHKAPNVIKCLFLITNRRYSVYCHRQGKKRKIFTLVKWTNILYNNNNNYCNRGHINMTVTNHNDNNNQTKIKGEIKWNKELLCPSLPCLARPGPYHLLGIWRVMAVNQAGVNAVHVNMLGQKYTIHQLIN